MRPVLFLLLIASGCSSRPAPEPLPVRPSKLPNPLDEKVIALYNGRPILWREVAEHTLTHNLKPAVDFYVRSRIMKERTAALGIVHTPEELRRRAEAEIRRAKRTLGEATFSAQLAREGTTEERYAAFLAASRRLNDMLSLDKALRYDALLQDRVRIERAFFSDEKAAHAFRAGVTEKGFESAPNRRVEEFPRRLPPLRPPLEPRTLEAVLALKAGEMTGVESAGPDLLQVIRVLEFKKALRGTYAELREKVLESILEDPPALDDYDRWLEGELRKARIEYVEK